MHVARRLIPVIVVIVMLFCSVACAQTAKSVSVTDFGAKGDGVTDDTGAIQAALDSLANGGGVANLPAGSYLISAALKIPGGATLLGEAVRWENTAVKLIVPKNGYSAVRLSHGSSVKGLCISYPNNTNNQKPVPYPPSILLEGINPSVENIVFDCSWIGISTPPGGANTGQAMLRDLTGFVHHVGIHLSGLLDVSRIQDVHWFVGGVNTDNTDPYFTHNRVAFEFGRVDGIILERCFMIGGKTFLHHLPYEDPVDKKAPAHSLGFAIDQCWIEYVNDGFIFEGFTGFTLSNCNILVRKNGVGVKVDAQQLYYNAVISAVQVRSAGWPVVGFSYNTQHPHPRNRLSIADCQVVDGAPAVHLGSGAARAAIHDCHFAVAPGEKAIVIDKGADLFSITNNVVPDADSIADNSGAPDSRKTVTGNLVETSSK